MARHKVAMTLEARKQRRAKIAAYVRRGNTAAEAVKHFGVTIVTVRSACIEHNVLQQTDGLRQQTSREVVVLQVLAQLIDTAATLQAIAEHCRLPAWRVQRIYERAIAAGIRMPPRAVTKTHKAHAASAARVAATTNERTDDGTNRSDDDRGSGDVAP